MSTKCYSMKFIKNFTQFQQESSKEACFFFLAMKNFGPTAILICRIQFSYCHSIYSVLPLTYRGTRKLLKCLQKQSTDFKQSNCFRTSDSLKCRNPSIVEGSLLFSIYAAALSFRFKFDVYSNKNATVILIVGS